MIAVLKFDFQKKKTNALFWSKLSKVHKKRPNFASDNYIFPKTRGNKNKQWTSSLKKFFMRPFVLIAHMFQLLVI